MPRDAVSRTANVERTGGHKWVKLFRARLAQFYGSDLGGSISIDVLKVCNGQEKIALRLAWLLLYSVGSDWPTEHLLGGNKH